MYCKLFHLKQLSFVFYVSNGGKDRERKKTFGFTVKGALTFITDSGIYWCRALRLLKQPRIGWKMGFSFALRPATFITKTRLNAVLFLGVLCGISDLHGYAVRLFSECEIF